MYSLNNSSHLVLSLALMGLMLIVILNILIPVWIYRIHRGEGLVKY